MSRKHSELEREFLDELALRTGRSLAEWMDAIAEAGIVDRNAIIDWLRPQGLTFAHASWLERIHHNGGRPIYLGEGGGASQAVISPSVKPIAAPAQPSLPTPAAVSEPAWVPVPAQPPPAVATKASPPLKVEAVAPAKPAAPKTPHASTAGPPAAAVPPAALANLLSRGKGLRMLADHILREIKRVVPTVRISASGDLVAFANPSEFAVLAVGPRELRLGLALGSTPAAEGVTPAKIAGAAASISHMAVLNDARQVDPALMSLVVLADQFTNPK